MKVETVQPGEKGPQRYRTDKRVKRYLLAKRPDPSKLEQLINYRTEACVACNRAEEDRAAQDVREFLLEEYDWAVSELAMRSPDVLISLANGEAQGVPSKYLRAPIDLGVEELVLFEKEPEPWQARLVGPQLYRPRQESLL